MVTFIAGVLRVTFVFAVTFVGVTALSEVIVPTKEVSVR